MKTKLRKWKQVACGCCAGIEWGGCEPRECQDCGGNGSLWLSPRGKALALYPGGPFRGKPSKKVTKSLLN